MNSHLTCRQALGDAIGSRERVFTKHDLDAPPLPEEVRGFDFNLALELPIFEVADVVFGSLESSMFRAVVLQRVGTKRESVSLLSPQDGSEFDLSWIMGYINPEFKPDVEGRVVPAN